MSKFRFASILVTDEMKKRITRNSKQSCYQQEISGRKIYGLFAEGAGFNVRGGSGGVMISALRLRGDGIGLANKVSEAQPDI